MLMVESDKFSCVWTTVETVSGLTGSSTEPSTSGKSSWGWITGSIDSFWDNFLNLKSYFLPPPCKGLKFVETILDLAAFEGFGM